MRSGRDGWRYGVVVASVALLSACGGDGDGDTPGGNGGDKPVPSPDATGHVATPFRPAAENRWILMSREVRLGMGTTTTLEQQPDGSLRTVGRYAADADVRVTGIDGNAGFAMGTWQGGAYRSTRDADGAATPYANADGAQYVVYRAPVGLPDDGARHCVAHFSPASGLTGATPVKVEGEASLDVNGGVAQAHVSLRIATSAGTVPVVRDSRFTADAFGLDAGALLAGGSGVGVTLGDTDGDGALLIAPWRVRSGGDIDAQGMAVFHCK
ncbi:hypothetical protein L602_003500000300 [Cupriavidus gilardii J11]|uniref:Lipoprotein n=1 Tax=Cupriavidus gilardii J11 TaxID=936133 RepID=A0A562BCA7_9BURK|nr:hypothetical protein [Cupriavidus gilardii]TWG82658.1 hypothetical protein L602_003500000300 [Cupriavidus gilardii J11]